MPPNIDMSAIQEALARRNGAAGGSGMPAQQQVTPGAPVQQPPQPKPTGPLATPSGGQGAPQGQPQAQGQPQGAQRAPGGQKQSANVDDNTRAMTKALVARMLNYL